jgi:hypothetical protein
VPLSDEKDRKLARHLSSLVSYPKDDGGEKSDKPAEPETEGDEEAEEAAEVEDVQLQRALDVLRGMLVQQKLDDRSTSTTAAALQN